VLINKHFAEDNLTAGHRNVTGTGTDSSVIYISIKLLVLQSN